jgi:RNA polymerase sigma-70 factor (ECF subfamily)
MPDEQNARLELERELESLHAASFGWALACCRRDRQEAADVLQQAYWKVLSGRARHDGRSSFKTWLFGVIRLTAMEERRSTVVRWLRRRDAPELNDVAAPSAPDAAADRETAQRLARALAGLAERQREVLHLVFYEGLTIAEAAGVMQVSLGTARLHYERGKAAMHHALTSEERGKP